MLIFIWLIIAALIGIAIGLGYVLPASDQLTYTKKFIIGGSQYSSIYLRDVNRNVESRLTNLYGINAVAKWSPDGEKIAYLSLDSGQFHIYVMDALGKM